MKKAESIVRGGDYVNVKTAFGKIFGARLTASEQKAMDIEIKKQLAEWSRIHELEIEAMILWQLHEQFGFGPVRLKRFHKKFSENMDNLVARYQIADEDQAWLCTYKLDKYGIDLEEWSSEECLN
jgi:hypothetical protein